KKINPCIYKRKQALWTYIIKNLPWKYNVEVQLDSPSDHCLVMLTLEIEPDEQTKRRRTTELKKFKEGMETEKVTTENKKHLE
ncbi:hypothetical protein HHI36_000901, partial [Cryptolaemus montrouzieri]